MISLRRKRRFLGRRKKSRGRARGEKERGACHGVPDFPFTPTINNVTALHQLTRNSLKADRLTTRNQH